MRRVVDRIVDLGGRRPLAVLATALAVMVLSWACASRLELRPDFMELLPRDSPGFRAFERQLDRVGGRATVLVLAASPDRRANQRCLTRRADLLEADPDGIHHVERGTGDARRFFDANRWLYATVDDLEEIDRTLDRQIALRSGLVVDLDPTPRDASLGLDARRATWEAEARKHDAFPSGWFADDPGTTIGLRVVSTSTGMADAQGDRLLARVKALSVCAAPTSFHPDMVVGFAGDLPRAAAEKQSLLESAALATGVALALIFAGIAWFYRSPWAIPIVAVPPLLGAGCAFAFAKLAYGYVNA